MDEIDLDADDVFVTRNGPQGQDKRWQLPPLKPGAATQSDILGRPESDSSTFLEIPTKVRPQRNSQSHVEGKSAGDLDIDFAECTSPRRDENLETPPLSPSSSTDLGDYGLPETPRTTKLLQQFGSLDVYPSSLNPPAICSVVDAEADEITSVAIDHVETYNSSSKQLPRYAYSAPSATDEELAIDAATLEILCSNHLECSDCTSTSINTKHFTDLCNYMVEHDLHGASYFPLESLRSFRPSNTSKIIALVGNDTRDRGSTRFYSLGARTSVFQRASFKDFFAYQKLHGDELVITCQTACVQHAPRPCIWSFEPPSSISEGAGSLETLTNKFFKRGRKYLLARKLEKRRNWENDITTRTVTKERAGSRI